jgi:hypothetical protein
MALPSKLLTLGPSGKESVALVTSTWSRSSVLVTDGPTVTDGGNMARVIGYWASTVELALAMLSGGSAELALRQEALRQRSAVRCRCWSCRHSWTPRPSEPFTSAIPRGLRAFTSTIARPRAWARRFVAPHVIPRLLDSTRLRRAAFAFVSELGIRYRGSPVVAEGEPRQRDGPRPGDRLPDAEVRVHGRSTYLQQALAGPHLALLLCGDPQIWDSFGLGRLRERYGPLPSVYCLSVDAFEDALVDQNGAAFARLGVQDAAQYWYVPTAMWLSGVRDVCSRRSSNILLRGTSVPVTIACEARGDASTRSRTCHTAVFPNHRASTKTTPTAPASTTDRSSTVSLCACQAGPDSCSSSNTSRSVSIGRAPSWRSMVVSCPR